MKVYLCRIVVPTIIVKLHAIILIHGLFWCMIWPKPLHIFHFHIDCIEYLLSFVIFFSLFIQNLLFSHLTHELISISSQFKLKTNESYIFNSSKTKRKKNWPTIFTAVPLCPFSALTIFAVFSLRWAFTLNVWLILIRVIISHSFLSQHNWAFFSPFVGFSHPRSAKKTLIFLFFRITKTH